MVLKSFKMLRYECVRDMYAKGGLVVSEPFVPLTPLHLELRYHHQPSIYPDPPLFDLTYKQVARREEKDADGTR